MGIELEALEDHTDLRTKFIEVGRRIANGDTIHDDFTFLEGFQAIDTSKKGALARAAWATHNNGLPRLDLLVDSIENLEIAIPFAHLFDLDQRLSSFFFLHLKSAANH
jgi:hypothetical protein